MNFIAKYNDPINSDSYLPDCVVFHNPQHLEQYHNPDLLMAKVHLEMRTPPSINSCSDLILIITSATVPAIKKLEVWGTPSRFNKEDIIKTVENIVWKTALPSRKSTILKPCADQIPPLQTSTLHNGRVDLTEDSNMTCKKHAFSFAEIPEEFIDHITCSLMSVPMLLPSGNNIDRSALDKFTKEQEKYGRHPSDPYTGKVFTKSQQPVPNVSLKARIDRYVLTNATRIESTSRTVGTDDTSGNNKTVETLQKGKKRKYTDIATIHKKVSNSKAFEHHTKKGLHSKSSELSTNVPLNIDVDYTWESSSQTSSISSPSHSLSSGSGLTPRDETVHESDLQSSLDFSLMQTLSALPLARNQHLNKIPSTHVCLLCKEHNQSFLYRLVCKHVFCRKCLNELLSHEKPCLKCNAPFQRKDAEKVKR